MKHLLRLIPVVLLATIIVLLSLAGSLTHSGKSKVSVPLTHSQGFSMLENPKNFVRPLRSASALSSLPMLFERNQGQFPADVRFVSRGKGYALAIQNQGATLTLRPTSQKGKPTVPHTLRMTLVGGNANTRIQGENEALTKINYMVGRDRHNWCLSVPTFDRVLLQDVYPGVDAVYYGNGRSLEYDFVVAPQASPKTVRLRFCGANAVQLNAHGDLVLKVGSEQVVQHAPVLYQQIEGARVPVAGRYVLLARNEVGFEVGNYDRSLPLVIDPTLVYSTYVGPDFLAATGFAVGNDGSTYITGTTYAPTIEGMTPVSLGKGQVQYIGTIFVAKLAPSGQSLQYVTYIGGSQKESDATGGSQNPYGIAVDGDGNAYVVGNTNLTDFPTANAYQSILNPRVRAKGDSYYEPRDAFLFKLSSSGRSLLYSTYLGGTQTVLLDNFFNDPDFKPGRDNAQDTATAVAVDDAGNAYVTGGTSAIDFPIVNGFQPNLAGSGTSQSTTSGPYPDAFVAKINTTASGVASLTYSTYIGGYGSIKGDNPQNPVDFGYGITTDGAGKVYVTGAASRTTDEPFPVKGGLPSGGESADRAFVTAIDSRKAGAVSLLASTLLDGTGPAGTGGDSIKGRSVALDSTGNVYVAGITNLSSIAGQPATSFGSSTTYTGDNAFAIKLKPDLSALQYTAFFCGSNGEEGATSVAVDDLGQAYVAGTTTSTDFPQSKPLSNIPAPNRDGDDFLAKLSASGTTLVYLTRIGGSKAEDNSGFGNVYNMPTVAFDGATNIYVGGNTQSTDFPTTAGAMQTTLRDTYQNAFVLKIKGLGLYVNSLGDGDDSNAAKGDYDGECSTGKTLSDGQSECTLRAAIQEANHSKTKPTINFDIVVGVAAGTIPKIALKKPLPSLDISMTLDGTSQAGVKRVWLNGASATAMSGLVVAGGDSLIKGLLINQVRGDGILVRTKGNNKIENCWVGLNDKGVADSKTGVAGAGVHILNSPKNIVGGANSDKRCVLSSNGTYGVWIDGATSTGNAVQGCFIGTDVSGTKAAGNATFGVLVGVQTLPKNFKTLPLSATIGGATTTAGSGIGNVISGNANTGVALVGVSAVRVQGNLVGTDKTGAKALPNGIGVLLFRSPNNIVSGNVASGNRGGIYLAGAETTGCTVQSNLVGTDSTGTKALPNFRGILLVAASRNTIGGSAATRNVISGNSDTGLFLDADSGLRPPGSFEDGAPRQNTISSNFVGVDKSGAKALPNIAGIALGDSLGMSVTNNVVSGNSQFGIVLFSRSEQQIISNNFVGTNAGGTAAIPNGYYGVLLLNAQKNTLNSNTISGNGRAGLVLAGKFPAGYPAPSSVLTENLVGPINNTFTRNFIGTSAGGASALPNGKAAGSAGAGVLVLPILAGDSFTGATGNVWGKSGQGNIVSGNAGAGFAFVGDTDYLAQGLLQYNFIGTKGDGKTSLANSGSGVSITKGSVTIGGGASGQGNSIAFNGGDGVTVLSGSGNRILNNAIFSNKKLGIDLKGDGVTPNRTTGTPDTKLPNLGQNFPELLAAKVANGKTTVQGLLKGAAKAQYRIEFFLNGSRDASGYGEGQKFVGAIEPTADSTGAVKFTTTLSLALSGTQFLSMTATDAKGNTSEFSGLSRAISGQAFSYVTDPKNASATLKQGLANVRIDRLDSKGGVKETTSTDSAGFYAFVGVPVGTWTIKPSSKTGSFDTKFDPLSRSVSVSDSAPAASGVDFATYAIYGTVKDVAGKALVNQNVSLVGLGRSTKTGKDGTYRFDGLGKGQYNVEFGDSFSPKFAIVTLPTSGTSGVSPNAKVNAQQGLSISGFVEDAIGKPLANVPVELVGTKIVPVVTDDQGRYEFEGLSVGTYKVAPKSSAGKFTPASHTVTLKDKSVDSVDFTKQGTSTQSISGGDA